MQINRKIIVLTLFLLLLSPSAPVCSENETSPCPRENRVVMAVRRVGPAVVNISSEYEVHSRIAPFSGFGMDSFFDSFFRDFFEPGVERRQKRSSLGSGVIIDGQRGLILTNEHVIAKTGTIRVVLNDEREFEARIVGADPDSDLAVLRIPSQTPLPAVDMGSSDALLIGETVIAIGNPFGFSHTVTTGVISAVNRSIRSDDRIFQDFIQTDASINPGNSGGPLLNINGELIGINTAIYAKAQGIGFAIPINKARRIVADLIRYGEVVQPWIGITVQDLDETIVSYLKLSDPRGVLISKLEPQSPAAAAGLLPGDVITALDGRQLQSSLDYHNLLKNYAAGDILEFHLWRNARTLTMAVQTARFPAAKAAELAYRLLGIKVADVSSRFSAGASQFARAGVVITQIRGPSYLARIGVEPGDVIRQIDDITVENSADFEKAVVKYRRKSSLVVLLQRGRQGYYITVRLPS